MMSVHIAYLTSFFHQVAEWTKPVSFNPLPAVQGGHRAMDKPQLAFKALSPACKPCCAGSNRVLHVH